MKKILTTTFALCILVIAVKAQIKSGAIEFESVMNFGANGMGGVSSTGSGGGMPITAPAFSQNFELLFTPTGASYAKVVETGNSNSGSGMISVISGSVGGGIGFGENTDYYYNFTKKSLLQIFELNDTTYAMPIKLKLEVAPKKYANGIASVQSSGAEVGSADKSENSQPINAVEYLDVAPTVDVVKSDETKEIVGFKCHKAIIKTTRKAKLLGQEKDITEETTLWYTNDLGFDFSPNPQLWIEGAVLGIETKGTAIFAKSIDYRKVAQRDVAAPKGAVSITKNQYEVKMESMLKKY